MGTNAFETDLWLQATNGQDATRFTMPSNSAFAPAWSPDGRWVAYLSNRPGKLPNFPNSTPQIYIAPVRGGEGVQLTQIEAGVDQFQWSPDSKSLVLLSSIPETRLERERKQAFGEYHIVHGDYAKSQLWLVGLPRDPGQTHPTPLQLTAGDDMVNDFTISPSGQQIAFAAQSDGEPVSTTADIYVLTLNGKTVRRIVSTPGPDGAPIWSPDGKQIAYRTSKGDPHFLFSNQKIAVVSTDGSSGPRVVNPEFDEDATPLCWTRDGILFTGMQHGMRRLFRLDTASKGVHAVSPDGFYINGVDVSPDGAHIAYRGASAGQMMEVYAAELTGGFVTNPRQLSHETSQLDAWPRSTRELVRWLSSDGTPIEGILEKPADFRPGKRYPLLVIVHGGPTQNDTPVIQPDRDYPAEQFLSRGALVLRPNYRGSTGYGETFRALDFRNLGVGDSADVLSGVSALVAQGLVDPSRVGAMGWSEGGFITAFLTTTSGRFAAVSVGAGISDWRTYYYGTDWTAFAQQYIGATPENDPAIYRKLSPIAYVSHAHTPTLIQQSSTDPRVPVAESLELRQALQDRGVPVKMVLYHNSGHMIETPKQQRAVMLENQQWFGHYVWGDPLLPDLTPAAAKRDENSQ